MDLQKKVSDQDSACDVNIHIMSSCGERQEEERGDSL